ncbi:MULTISPECIES: hypothetical protein [Sphaerimonospora]|uniref:Uncharacterized protein n=2 Tax=Sphaerimonospora TaxID=1792303 RepID=A0A8J3RCJ1_9ACTN|nr:hypothetical protein [Sphaerimonospora thailandensis]GIH72105.1 hypothetical protein Mth01_43580 [Sphaerimonospora thailandensis]
MNELIAGYANYTSTEAILHEQHTAAVKDANESITLTVTVSWTWTWTWTY